jgi:hypothetical protein
LPRKGWDTFKSKITKQKAIKQDIFIQPVLADTINKLIFTQTKRNFESTAELNI